MKILWSSNAPYASSGYGVQTRLFTRRLKDMGHEVAILAFWGLEGGLLNLDGLPIYPKGMMAYGQDVMAAHSAHFGADICISLIDAWVINPEMVRQIKWIPWFPIDHEPVPPAVARAVARAYKRIAMSKFGQAELEKAGMDSYYIPHGVETSVYKPMDRVQAKEFCGFPKDRFVVGMVAANKGMPSRKAFTENIGAFAELKKHHDDVWLYLHTSTGANSEYQGQNLPEYLNYLGLKPGRDYAFPDQYSNLLGYPQEWMVAAYNSMDVHLLVSMGEGFGIPILEAQACGVPVITGDWTAMPEITFSGWKVLKSEAQPWWTPQASFQYQPSTMAIYDRLESAYRHSGEQFYRDLAREGALEYDADLVAEKYWKPALADIEQCIQGQDEPVKLVKFA